MKKILLIGSQSNIFKEIISKALSPFYNSNLLIAETDSLEGAEAFLKSCTCAPLLVANNAPSERIHALLGSLGQEGFLVVDNSNGIASELREKGFSNFCTFGLGQGSDFLASDVKVNGGINFKVNSKGSSIPFWLEKERGEEQVPAALAAAALGSFLGFNLVEISQALKAPDKNQVS
jgi:hypothetical protein